MHCPWHGGASELLVPDGAGPARSSAQSCCELKINFQQQQQHSEYVRSELVFVRWRCRGIANIGRCKSTVALSATGPESVGRGTVRASNGATSSPGLISHFGIIFLLQDDLTHVKLNRFWLVRACVCVILIIARVFDSLF